MSTVWLHVRNSPIRWALPVLVVVDLAVLFLRNRYWIGVWPETGAAAQVPAYLLGIVGAGAAAWSAGAPQRHGLEEQLRAARVQPVVSEAHRLHATVIVLLIPYLIGQTVAFAVTARTFPPGVHLWLGYLLLGLFAILLSVALVATRRLRSMQRLYLAGLGIGSAVIFLGICAFVMQPEIVGVIARSWIAWFGLALAAGATMGWRLAWTLPSLVAIVLSYWGYTGNQQYRWWEFSARPHDDLPSLILSATLLAMGLIAYAATPWRRRRWRRWRPEAS